MTGSRTVYLSPHPYQVDLPAQGTLVTPNPRAAASWGKAPCSLDSLARRVLRDARWLVASAPMAYRTLRQAVDEVMTPDDLEGTTRVVAESLRALLRANLGVVRRHAGTPRVKALCDLAEHYQSLLDARQLVDAAEMLWRAATIKPPHLCLHVRGYPRLGAAELTFLDALAGDGSSLVLPSGQGSLFEASEEAATHLVNLGWRLERQVAVPETLGERVSLGFTGVMQDGAAELVADCYPHLEAEVRGALHCVKSLLLQGVSAGDIVLVTRDETRYGPVVRAVAREFALPVRTYERVPLSESYLGGWLRLAADSVLSDGRFEPTAGLLGHTLSARLSGDSWREARRKRPDNFAAWSAVWADVAILQWPERASREIYLQHLRTALEYFEVKANSARQLREKTAYHQLQRALLALATPAEEVLTCRRFWGEVAELTALLRVAGDPHLQSEQVVALHTPLALYGARIPHVIVMGLAEGIFPAVLQDDPVLDFYARKQLHSKGIPLEDARAAALRERLSFWTLLQVATSTLKLSYPSRIDDQLQLPGAHITALGLTVRQAPERSPASPEEARRLLLQRTTEADAVLPQAYHAWQVELRRESATPHDAYDGVLDIPRDPAEHIFSASQLTALGQCPYRWFAGYLLCLAEPKEVDEELAPDLRGTFYHRVLELTLSQALQAESPRTAALAALDTCFAKAEMEKEVTAVPNWSGQRHEHLELLRRTLQADDFFLEDTAIMGLEQTFEGDWHGLRVRGVVDRIDKSAAGLVLTDYKTRKSKPEGVRDASGRGRLDIQLPLYVQAAAPILYPEYPVASARYYSLTASKVLMEAKPNDEALKRFADQVRWYLEHGTYPVDPDEGRTACSYCDFDLLCRQGPRIERKRHAEP